MINGERTISRPLRWGMVGGGRTGQVGLQASNRGAARRHLSSPCRRLRSRCRARARVRRQSWSGRGPLLRHLPGLYSGRNESERRGRSCLGCNAKLHPLRNHQSASRSRHPRDLREAAFFHLRRMRRDCRARRAEGADCRRDLWLHGPSAGASDGPPWSLRACSVRYGLSTCNTPTASTRAMMVGASEAMEVAHQPQDRRLDLRAGRHRHAMSITFQR